MVLVTHVPYYREIFAIPEFLRDPLLCFGFQEFDKGATLDGKQYLHLGEYFATLGITATSLDLFDPRSELRYDMNYAVPESEHSRYSTFIDIGSLEYGDALCPHGAHKRSRRCLQPAQRLDRVRQVLEQLAVFHTHYPVVDPRLQPGF